MMYDEFTSRLPEGVKAPTFAEYTDFIEPVYNYHPVFSGVNAKDRAAELYRVGGLGIFATMRDVAEMAKDEEDRVTEQRRRAQKLLLARDAAKRAYEQAQAEYDSAMEDLRTAIAESREFHAAVRAEWEV